MGINGLIPFLQKYHQPVHLSQFKGQTIGIDGYVWLHRGVFSCALELFQDPVNGSRRYVDYCIKRVNELRDAGIEPFLVFDGGHLPIKKSTEDDRHKLRQENKKKILIYLHQKDYSKATEYAQKCTDVTPWMARQLILKLRQLNVQYIVAPYEADAQLAFLQSKGFIDAIITEDSDLLAFGCQNVIFKLDKNGNGLMISANDIGTQHHGWSQTKTRHMCILSGCDYLKSMNGVGLTKAEKGLIGVKDGYSLLKKWKSLGKLVSAPTWIPGYDKLFFMADLTFLHQSVYDPFTQSIIHLTALKESLTKVGVEDDSFLGPHVESHIALGIAQGDIDPITKIPYELNYVYVYPDSVSSSLNIKNENRDSTHSNENRNYRNIHLLKKDSVVDVTEHESSPEKILSSQDGHFTSPLAKDSPLRRCKSDTFLCSRHPSTSQSHTPTKPLRTSLSQHAYTSTLTNFNKENDILNAVVNEETNAFTSFKSMTNVKTKGKMNLLSSKPLHTFNKILNLSQHRPRLTSSSKPVVQSSISLKESPFFGKRKSSSIMNFKKDENDENLGYKDDVLANKNVHKTGSVFARWLINKKQKLMEDSEIMSTLKEYKSFEQKRHDQQEHESSLNGKENVVCSGLSVKTSTNYLTISTTRTDSLSTTSCSKSVSKISSSHFNSFSSNTNSFASYNHSSANVKEALSSSQEKKNKYSKFMRVFSEKNI